MKSWLKRHFIPHPGNDHRPHFLHTKNTRAILAAVLVFELILFILPAMNFVRWVDNANLASVLPGVLSSLANDERRDNNLTELKVSAELTKAAELKAQDMANKSYFAHTSPEGLTPWYWLNQVGYQYEYAGENLAINFVDSKDVTRAWMKSPSHRANIVKSNYTEVGTGVATGIYDGRKTIFVAQVYANPRVSTVQDNLARLQTPTTPRSNETETQVAVNTNPSVTPTPEPEAQQQPTPTIETNPDVVSADVNENEVLGASAPLSETLQQASVPSDQNSGALQSPKTPTKIAELLSSPRHTTNLAFFAVLVVISLALLLKLFVRVDIQHPDLVANGLVVVTAVVAILLFNNFLSVKNIEISRGMDYSKDQIILNLR